MQTPVDPSPPALPLAPVVLNAPVDAHALEQVRARVPGLLEWQRRAGRHGMPWQQQRTAYRVWISEVMLQQTQVSAVIGYYQRFMDRFPSVHSLAAASLDDVLAHWSGLGYYSRARNLHRTAQTVVSDHAGDFPRDAAALAELPGIGLSTAIAIASICFGERRSIFDGNVKRVMARALGYDADLSRAAAARALWSAADSLVPADPADMPTYTQALMDLGATLCKPRNPECGRCPLAGACVARATGQQQLLPRKAPKPSVDPSASPNEPNPVSGPHGQRGRQERANVWLWLQRHDRVWVQRRPTPGVWAGLWSLPLLTAEEARSVADDLSLLLEPGRVFKHVLTHFDWHLAPWRSSLDDQSAERVASCALLAPGHWMPLSVLAAAGIPAPLKKLIACRRAPEPNLLESIPA